MGHLDKTDYFSTSIFVSVLCYAEDQQINTISTQQKPMFHSILISLFFFGPMKWGTQKDMYKTKFLTALIRNRTIMVQQQNVLNTQHIII
jgi:hypothetical protein